jgi:hypothetical protein
MVDFGLFHSPLACLMGKKGENLAERLILVLGHVGKRPTLAILQKFRPINRDPGHRDLGG